MNFTRANLTDAGLALNAKIQKATGDVPLHITRVALGAGTSETPTSQTDVVNPIDLFVPIIRQTSHGNMAEIQIQITNVGNPDLNIPPLAAAITFQQIGFFAIDPDLGEILYRISQLNSAAFIPPVASLPFTAVPVYVFTTANAETVIITVDPAGLVTVRMLDDHNNDPAAHPNLLALHDLDAIIPHNLNAYPAVTAIEFTYGYGYGGYGETPYGGSVGRQLRSLVTYLDRDNLQVAVGKQFGQIESVEISREREYVVRFADSVIALCLALT